MTKALTSRCIFLMQRLSPLGHVHPCFINSGYQLFRSVKSQQCFSDLIKRQSCYRNKETLPFYNTGYVRSKILDCHNIDPRMWRQSFARLSCRQYGIRKDHISESSEGKKQIPLLQDTALGVRLATENGYLSWCRNCYLMTVVALTMSAQGHNILTHHAALAAFGLAGINLVFGTISFIHGLVVQRQIVQMTYMTVFITSGLAVFHFLLWTSIMIIFVAEVTELKRKTGFYFDNFNNYREQ
ncbi:hypothetical protein CHS0354_034891 [Potamilus streckersoni]|uniref:Uncharacterized protein n=1 Tax=Potamilus streckersoni TaxID=2493646 RepID=A0AAE0S8A8_9BIVA|nr:hypothetical protein CHS0354_034891 [Potamilus streckersoni]